MEQYLNTNTNLDLSFLISVQLPSLPTGRSSRTQLMMMENGTTLMLDGFVSPNWGGSFVTRRSCH